MSKNMVEPEGPQMTSQYGAYALHAGLARLYARMRMHTPTRPGTHMHARTRKHAHTDQYVILIAFPQQQWFRERASLLRYTYIACLVHFRFLFFQSVYFCTCVNFSFTLTDYGCFWFEDYISNVNSSHASSIFCIYSVTLPSPFRVPADVALPTIDELANEFIRLNLRRWASR